MLTPSWCVKECLRIALNLRIASEVFIVFDYGDEHRANGYMAMITALRKFT